MSQKIDKEAVKAEIISWLKVHGYPNIPQQDYFILNHLDNIFKHLLSKRLVREEMYEGFLMGANMAWYRKTG